MTRVPRYHVPREHMKKYMGKISALYPPPPQIFTPDLITQVVEDFSSRENGGYKSAFPPFLGAQAGAPSPLLTCRIIDSSNR